MLKFLAYIVPNMHFITHVDNVDKDQNVQSDLGSTLSPFFWLGTLNDEIASLTLWKERPFFYSEQYRLNNKTRINAKIFELTTPVLMSD